MSDIYRHGQLPQKPHRWWLWLLVLITVVLYSCTVYDWWQEGNINFERQRSEQINESIVSRH